MEASVVIVVIRGSMENLNALGLPPSSDWLHYVRNCRWKIQFLVTVDEPTGPMTKPLTNLHDSSDTFDDISTTQLRVKASNVCREVSVCAVKLVLPLKGLENCHLIPLLTNHFHVGFLSAALELQCARVHMEIEVRVKL